MGQKDIKFAIMKKKVTEKARVSGMGCQGCVNTIEGVLRSREGVESASVSLSDELATITYEPETVSR
jgi:copper chaperone CopZ